MNGSDQKSTIRNIFDALIGAFIFGAGLLLIIGGINAIFGSSLDIKFGGSQPIPLPEDFRSVFLMAVILLGIALFLFVVSHYDLVWALAKRRPISSIVTITCISLLLIYFFVPYFQERRVERLSDENLYGNLQEVENLLNRHEFEPQFLYEELARAVNDGKYEIAVALIQAGANINTSESWSDDPLLSFAVKHGDLESVYFLLEHGADPNGKDQFEDPPLISFIRFRLGQNDILMEDAVAFVEALLEAGADPLLQDKFGRSARDLAENEGYVEILELFP